MKNNKFCTFHSSGYCRNKISCPLPHQTNTCLLGQACPNKNVTCFDRHPKVCKRFLVGECGFYTKNKVWVPYQSCAFLHRQETLEQEPHGARSKIQLAHQKIAQLERKLEKLQSEFQSFAAYHNEYRNPTPAPPVAGAPVAAFQDSIGSALSQTSTNHTGQVDILRLSPGQEVVLSSTSDGDLAGRIQIQNISSNIVGYKITTTSPKKYRIRPSTGSLSPGLTVTAEVHVSGGQATSTPSSLVRDRILITALFLESSELGQQQLADTLKTSKPDGQYRLRYQLAGNLAVPGGGSQLGGQGQGFGVNQVESDGSRQVAAHHGQDQANGSFLHVEEPSGWDRSKVALPGEAELLTVHSGGEENNHHHQVHHNDHLHLAPEVDKGATMPSSDGEEKHHHDKDQTNATKVLMDQVTSRLSDRPTPLWERTPYWTNKRAEDSTPAGQNNNILTIQDDKNINQKCKNCKHDPCLGAKQVTIDNLIHDNTVRVHYTEVEGHLNGTKIRGSFIFQEDVYKPKSCNKWYYPSKELRYYIDGSRYFIDFTNEINTLTYSC